MYLALGSKAKAREKTSLIWVDSVSSNADGSKALDTSSGRSGGASGQHREADRRNGVNIGRNVAIGTSTDFDLRGEKALIRVRWNPIHHWPEMTWLTPDPRSPVRRSCRSLRFRAIEIRFEDRLGAYGALPEPFCPRVARPDWDGAPLFVSRSRLANGP